ncbi:MAG: hypothetical protein EPO07_06895 [Verrucomicrobia bacterium]|nr:MAG: hypothetical protein EPO07_06895 [Verrucomicrobiota bacterium]
MKILLQQRESGLYLRELGDWTPDAGQAMDFLSSTRAIDFCATHRIGDVQLVLKFEEQSYDIVLPMVMDRRANGLASAHLAARNGRAAAHG